MVAAFLDSASAPAPPRRVWMGEERQDRGGRAEPASGMALANGQPVPNGDYLLGIRARDTAGNIVERSQPLVIEDSGVPEASIVSARIGPLQIIRGDQVCLDAIVRNTGQTVLRTAGPGSRLRLQLAGHATRRSRTTAFAEHAGYWRVGLNWSGSTDTERRHVSLPLGLRPRPAARRGGHRARLRAGHQRAGPAGVLRGPGPGERRHPQRRRRPGARQDLVLSGRPPRVSVADRLVQHARSCCWRPSPRWSTSRASRRSSSTTPRATAAPDAIADALSVRRADPLGDAISASRRASNRAAACRCSGDGAAGPEPRRALRARARSSGCSSCSSSSRAPRSSAPRCATRTVGPRQRRSRFPASSRWRSTCFPSTA